MLPPIVDPPSPFECPVDTSYSGAVWVWDLDKTYLQTQFESMIALVRTALESAEKKVTYPGAPALLRTLRVPTGGGVRPTYFVSASPRQMRGVITNKFLLDKVDVDGIYFKNNARNLRPGRWGRLKEQTGYKLLALLDLKRQLPPSAKLVMFGDDAESDAITYAIFSAILRGELQRTTLVNLLRRHGVFRDEALRIAWAARKVQRHTAEHLVYLRMHRATDQRYFKRFGRHIRGFRNTLELSVDLFLDDLVETQAVVHVAQEVHERHGIPKRDVLEEVGAVLERRDAPDRLEIALRTALQAGLAKS